MGGSSRQECNEAQSKYKCPSCLIPYHEETPCAKPESAEEKEKLSSVPQFQPETPVDVDGASEVLLKLRLEAIASSSEICNALKDEHLQKLIYDIYKSPDPIERLDKAMGTDVFRIFTDKFYLLSTHNCIYSKKGRYLLQKAQFSISIAVP